jgi:hypothetical protein
VSYLKLAPLRHVSSTLSLNDIHAYQYLPGLFGLGAFKNIRQNALFSTLLFMALVSLIGRYNFILACLSDLFWASIILYGAFKLLISSIQKIDIYAPRILGLFTEIREVVDQF